MEFQGKALYNLLRLGWENDPSSDVESWQVEDYRSLSEEQLFSRLANLNVQLDVSGLSMYVEQCDNPEELANCLAIEENNEKQCDQIYLLVFELWRRSYPDKPSLSIFCDEIDHLIKLFDDGEEIDEDLMTEHLHNLENILDNNVDHGSDPQKVFDFISNYFAHNLEGFLYDYVSELIDIGSETLASEIIDGFIEYVRDPRWFNFLRIKLVAVYDTDESEILFARLLEDVIESPDYMLYVEILYYLFETGKFKLFLGLLPNIIKLISNEEQFQELLGLFKDFLIYTERDESIEMLDELLDRRSSIDPSEAFDVAHQDVKLIKELTKSLDESSAR